MKEQEGVRPCWRAVRGCVCAADKIYKGQGLSNTQGSPEQAAKVYGRQEKETESRGPVNSSGTCYTASRVPVCMSCACVRASLCVCVHAYAFMCAKYVDMYICMYIHMYVDMCMHMYMGICVCMCV